MKKRIYSLLICIILLAVQLFAGPAAVYADGDVKISSEVSGMVSIVDGKTFVPPMGIFNAYYEIENNSSSKITIVSVVERLQGINEEYPLSIADNIEIKPGETLSFPGRSFDAELAINPNVINCRVFYTAKGSDQQIYEVATTTSVNVINVDMDVTYTSDLQGPVFKGDQAALKVEVESRSNLTLYNLNVIDRDLGQQIGYIDVLAPGQIKSVEATIPLENTTKGDITIEYDDPMGLGEKFQKHFDTDLEIEVRQEAPVSSLTISSKPEKNLIPGQASVKLELKIKNTGNTVLKQLECIDWEGKVFHTHDQLLPDEEITVVYTATVKPDTAYQIQAQAKVEDSNQLIKSSDTVQLAKLNPMVEIQRRIVPETIEAGKPFVIEYLVRNTGNVDLVDVVVEEPSFGEIVRFDLIPAGSEVEFKSKELTITKEEVSRTILNAKEAEMETGYNYEASELVIAFGDSKPRQELSIVLIADKNRLNKPGTVEMECIIKNTGQEALYNLVLTLLDREMVIDNISVLESGEEKVIKITPFYIEESETFLVEANGIGVDQVKFTAKSEDLTIQVEKGGSSGRDTLLRVVLIIIILLCILIVGVLVYLLKGSGKIRFSYRRKGRRVRDR